MSDRASERALALVLPQARSRARTRSGYLDLLASDPVPTGAVQNLMRSSAVTRIYERYWRPALGRLAKGAFGPGMTDEHRIAIRLLAVSEGERVLDVACGPGNFARSFARAVGDSGLVVGIDASRPMLERAVAEANAVRAGNLALVHGDAVELPFRASSFDAVCCFAALHLFADPDAALDQMARVLRRGGRIALFTSCRGRSAPVRAFEALVGARSGMRMFEQDEVVEALERRGFTEIRRLVSGFTQFVGGRLRA